MTVITDIKQQKDKQRVNVYLDGQFGFGIDLDNFVLLDLKVDQELSDKEIEAIVKKSEFQKNWDKLLRFSMVRPRSEREILDYFKRKKVYEGFYDEFFEKLRHLDLLDDEKFTIWWVEQRNTFRPKPKRVLSLELRTKGIKKEIIEKVLQDTDVNEEKMAKEILKKKMYKWKNLDGFERKSKIKQYLAGKGFSWEVIGKIVDDFNEDKDA